MKQICHISAKSQNFHRGKNLLAIKFVVQPYEMVMFDSHFQSYKVSGPATENLEICQHDL
jgi:hypothetical protein